MRESAEGHRRIGDRWSEAIAVAGLGTAARVRGHAMEAWGHYRAALAGLDDSGDHCGHAQLSKSLGSTYVLLGEHARTQEWLGRAWELPRAMGEPHREAEALMELGSPHREREAWQESLDCFRRAPGILDGLHEERCAAHALSGLGRTLSLMGEAGRGRVLCGRAQAVFRRTRSERGAGMAGPA